MDKQITCPICKCEYCTPYKPKWAACNNCTTHFAYDYEKNLDGYYRNKYHTGNYPTEPDIKAQNARAIRQYQFLVDNGIFPKKVLEWGCGQAMLLKRFIRLLHSDCYAVELNKRDRTLLANSGIRVEMYLKDIPDNDFDLIVSSHSIEHVGDPVGLIQELKQKLFGHILFEIPNESQDISKCIAEKPPSSDIIGNILFEIPQGGGNFPHLFAFWEKSIDAMMYYAGLETIKKQQLDTTNWLYLCR